MTIYTWPTLSRNSPAELEWSLISNTQEFTSPLSNSVQTVEMPGAKWRASFTMQNLTEDDAALLQAFMTRLRGKSGRFTLHNMARFRPRGTHTGAALVYGAGQSGTTLAIDGCAAGATLLAGDFFGVNGELKMVVESATANGAGQMVVTFEPPLRASPADNAPITVDSPVATFRLEDDAVRWTTRAPKVSDVVVVAIEAF